MGSRASSQHSAFSCEECFEISATEHPQAEALGAPFFGAMGWRRWVGGFAERCRVRGIG
jgi:hypothetical protein